MRSGNTFRAHGFEGAEGHTLLATTPSGLLVRAAGHSQPIRMEPEEFFKMSDPIDHAPFRLVNVDSEFINCHTLEEIRILLEIYEKVPKTANPLGLYQAQVASDMFQIANSYVWMEERWRSLMRNLYPLKDVVESEPGPETKSEARSKAGEDSAGLRSLLSRL